jgi:ankyrin repeat protein
MGYYDSVEDDDDNVDQRDESNFSPLFLAIEEKSTSTILDLIEKGADPNQGNGNGITPY